jgi:type I restriction enzyme, S subunit
VKSSTAITRARSGADIPEGWAAAAITDVSRLIRGVSYAKGEVLVEPRKGFLPLLRANNIDGEVRFTDLQYVPGHRVSVEQALMVGDVVVAMSSGSKSVVGKAASLRKAWAGTFGAFCAVLRPVPGIDPRFFGLFFQTREYRSYISEASAGTNINNLKRSSFAEFEIPLPPLVEQKRIVAKVEELLAHVNAARERLAHVPAILKRFRQAVLAAASEGKLSKGWRGAHPTMPIKEILSVLGPRPGATRPRRGVPEAVETPEVIVSLELPESWGAFSVAQLLRTGALLDLKDGNHGANHPKVADFTASGLPFITAAQVKDFQIDYDGAYKVSGEPLEKLRVGFAKPGDAILTHKGSVGRSALNTQECVLTPQTTYYRPNVQIISPGYLVFLFAAPHFYSQLAQVMSQTTRDFVPISEQYRLFLILPPKEEQDEIVRRVGAFFKLADVIEKRVAAATARAERLTQAILAKAFRGELVPTEVEMARREGRIYKPAALTGQSTESKISNTRPPRRSSPGSSRL